MAEGDPKTARDDEAKRSLKLSENWWVIAALVAWSIFLALAITFFNGNSRVFEGNLTGENESAESDRQTEGGNTATQFDSGGDTAGGAGGGSRDADSTLDIEAAATTLADADRFHEEGDFQQALHGYEDLQRQAGESLANSLEFRIGMCAEQLGDHDRALASYREVAGSTHSPVLQDVCRIGLARIHSHEGHHELAVAVLSDLRLSPASGTTEPRINAAAAHLLADSLVRQVTSGLNVDPLDDGSTNEPEARGEVNLLQLAGGASTQISDQEIESPPAELQRTFGSGGNPEQVQLAGRLDRTAIQGVVSQLILAGGLSADWSAAAERAVLGRSLEVSIESMSLATALDLLLLPSGLLWTTDDELVVIRSAAEVDEQERWALQIDYASRALMVAAYQYPESSLAASSMLWLGNIAFLQRDYSAAADYYEQLLRQFPQSSVSMDAWFNLSKSHLARGNGQEALEGFYRVMDADIGGDREPYAYLYAGRLLIGAGECDRAVSHLLRARAVAETTETRSQAALLLSTAYLMSGNPHGANLVLMKHRDELNKHRDHHIAAVLGGLSRYQAALRPQRKEREARALLAALSHVQPTDLFGRHGWWLLGQAYRELGFSMQAMNVFDDGLAQQIPVPYRRDIQLGLAELRQQGGDLAGAMRLLGELAASDESRSASIAQQRLARISLEQGDLPAALAFSRAALQQNGDDAERIDVLQIMGRVYERAGDHASAALCFAGAAPSTEIQVINE